MGSRGLVVLIFLLFALALAPPAARAAAPTISNVTWNPWVPAFREYVVIEADVVSPDGPVSVTAAWCILPPFTCIPFSMSDPEPDGRYTSPPIFAAEFAGSNPATGAYFNVTAVDSLNNYAFTEKFYVAFANTTTVDVALTPSSVAPNQAVAILGAAVYQNNSSAPARFSAVDFRILETGASWSVISDASGNFASSFTAPATAGSYTLRTTVSNRTISGSKDRYLAVASEPTADLAVVPGSLTLTPSTAVVGGEVTIAASVENRGTTAAGPFSVRINVTGQGGTIFSRDFPVSGLAVGALEKVSMTWTAAEGTWTITVIIDTGQQVSELSEENNRAGRAITVTPAPSNGPSATLIVGLVMAGIGVAAAVAFTYRSRTRRTKLP